METKEVIYNLRKEVGLNRKEFSEYMRIPLRTLEDWETGRRKPPEYIPRLMYYQIKYDALQESSTNKKNKNVDIIKDMDGNQIVVINDLRFKGRRSVDWKLVEECLKEYIGECTKITSTSDMVYIGSDFPDEFAHSKDTKSLRGANLYAKANSSSIIKEMIEIASNKSFAENYKKKHDMDAKLGWYRYDVRFAIPIYNNENELVRYNVFKARLLVRHAEDGKLYLYDIVRIKKEASEPLEQ